MRVIARVKGTKEELGLQGFVKARKEMLEEWKEYLRRKDQQEHKERELSDGARIKP